MLDQAEDRKHTAYHEAGHAVAAFENGWQIGPGGVEIEGDNWICHVRYPSWDAKSIWHHALSNCAGWVAECKLSDRPLLHDDAYLLNGLEDFRRSGEDSDWADDGGDDYHTISLILERQPDATDREVLAIYREHQQRAIELMSDPVQWAAVERIAAALIEKGKLSAEEVTALYDSAMVKEAAA